MRNQRVYNAALLLVLSIAAAAYYVLIELHRPGQAAHDIYAHFVPNMLHASRSFWNDGKGLLWNPFQSAGHPFLANIETALLYPPNVLFLVLDANTAVHVVLIINLIFGAVGMFMLIRELGMGRLAALGGALAFEVGDPMAQLTIWSPTKNGAWACVPWALFFCERLLRRRSGAAIVGLAVAVGLELLAGFVLITALTYQLIGLRLGWELITRWRERPWPSLVAVVTGLAIGPLLIAIELLPAAELAEHSLRAFAESSDITQWGQYSPSQILDAMGVRGPPAPFIALPVLLAVVAVLARETRRRALYFVVIGAVYAVLAFGRLTPLFDLYAKLPPGAAAIRVPIRMFWITGLSLSILTALGLEALQYANGASRWVGAAVIALLTVGLWALIPHGLYWVELIASAALLISLIIAGSGWRWARFARWGAAAALVLNLLAVPVRYPDQLLSSLDVYWSYVDNFRAIPSPMSEQDRMFIMPPVRFLGVMLKTATIFEMPALYDYEALLGRRFAEYFAMMRQGTPLRSMTEVYAPSRWLTKDYRRRLLNLAAVHYLVADPYLFVNTKVLNDMPRASGTKRLDIYFNEASYPRARFVPHLQVMSDPVALLDHLANSSDDLGDIVFVEEPLPSGFSGVAGGGGHGTAHFVTNDPEHLVIDVDASAAGFLVIADQYYPGWNATVNGAATSIARANYMFRLVEVPAGASRVELRFQPRSLVLGVLISAITAVAALIVVLRGRARNGSSSIASSAAKTSKTS